MNLNEAVVLRTYPSETVACIAHSRLRFEGIDAHIQKDDCGGAYPSLQMSRGVRLLVRPEDLQDAERILDQMETEECRKFQGQWERENHRTNRSNWMPPEVSVVRDMPTELLDELKSVIFPYVVIAPLLSALFAEKIDNVFVACLLFLGLVGTAFLFLRNRIGKLEESLREQERRIKELEGRHYALL